jgi:hypothetical protein
MPIVIFTQVRPSEKRGKGEEVEKIKRWQRGKGGRGRKRDKRGE